MVSFNGGFTPKTANLHITATGIYILKSAEELSVQNILKEIKVKVPERKAIK